VRLALLDFIKAPAYQLSLGLVSVGRKP
jgi:hypothetical protein